MSEHDSLDESNSTVLLPKLNCNNFNDDVKVILNDSYNRTISDIRPLVLIQNEHVYVVLIAGNLVL